MLSYAEDEADVEGTVNGIASTTTGEAVELSDLGYTLGLAGRFWL